MSPGARIPRRSGPRAAACRPSGEAFEEYLTANPNRKTTTEALYQSQMRYCLGDWLARPLDTITRRDVEARFHRVSQRNGWAVANHIIALLRSVYRRPCVDHETLRNPVDLWHAGGGRYHRAVRRRISTPAETLPRWWAAIEAEVTVGGDAGHLLVRDVYGDAPRRDHGALLGTGEPGAADPAGGGEEDRRAAGAADHPAAGRAPRAPPPSRPARPTVAPSPWVFPSTGASGHAIELQHTSTVVSVGRRVASSGSTGSGTCSSRWRSGS